MKVEKRTDDRELAAMGSALRKRWVRSNVEGWFMSKQTIFRLVTKGAMAGLARHEQIYIRLQLQELHGLFREHMIREA